MRRSSRQPGALLLAAVLLATVAVFGPTFAVPPAATSKLSTTFDELWALLCSREEAVVEGVDPSLHELSAPSSRKAWQELAELVTQQESPLALDGSKYVSLRLDGCMFGRLTRELRAIGLLGPGYSEEIGEIMRLCCRAMMDEFKGNVAFTHSDEMTILMFPRDFGRGGQPFEWPHKGRIQKWVSIGASMVTALFNRRLAKLADEKGIELPEDVVAHFDCRAGLFDTEKEALALLLWRAYDCSVNCVQDACHHLGAPLEVVRSDFAQKLRWLNDADLLPLHPHQAYGSMFVKGLGQFEATVSNTNETVMVTRKDGDPPNFAAATSAVLFGDRRKMSSSATSFDAEHRTAVPESVRHSLLLQEEIAKMSAERSEESKVGNHGGSLQRWQGPYWWNSLKSSKIPSAMRR
eukprot:symbB.v1.2.017631.t1/scaffold1340.1/size241236/16